MLHYGRSGAGFRYFDENRKQRAGRRALYSVLFALYFMLVTSGFLPANAATVPDNSTGDAPQAPDSPNNQGAVESTPVRKSLAEGEEQVEVEMPEHSLLGAGMRMFVSLLLVLALIAGSVFLLKKMTPYKGLISTVKSPVLVLSKVPLGQKKSICLVKIADEILILGLTNTTVSLLSKIKAEDYYAEYGGDAHQASGASNKHGFQKLYSALINSIKQKDSGRA